MIEYKLETTLTASAGRGPTHTNFKKLIAPKMPERNWTKYILKLKIIFTLNFLLLPAVSISYNCKKRKRKNKRIYYCNFAMLQKYPNLPKPSRFSRSSGTFWNLFRLQNPFRIKFYPVTALDCGGHFCGPLPKMKDLIVNFFICSITVTEREVSGKAGWAITEITRTWHYSK